MKKDRATIIRIVVLIILLPMIALLAWQLSKYMDKQKYRLDYTTLIRRYAGEFELDPYLVAAVIHCESGNRAEAVSNAGAIGLMQVMPETGEWIASKLKVDDFDAEMLKSPEINIRFGCWYLNFIAARFEDREAILAAYNAGHNRVKGWLEDPDYSADGSSLDEVPYPETAQYIEKVQRAYDKYVEIYPEDFN